MVYKNIKNI